MGTLADLTRCVLDLIFPLHCLSCRREGGVICAECTLGLKRLEQPYCQKCAQPSTSGICYWCRAEPPAFDSLRAPFLFEGPVREGVHRLKYRGHRVIAAAFADMLADFYERAPIEADLVVPVPLHPRRLRRRGYNQSSLLARQLAKDVGLEFSDSMLVRSRDSAPQVEAKSGTDRRGSVAGAFAAREECDGLSVLLVDDVATTGSTLSECAAALKASGARSVRALALAREG